MTGTVTFLHRFGTPRILVPAGLAAILAAQAAWFVATTSPTVDEAATYLELGQGAYRRADFGPFADNGVAPLPILLSYALPVVVLSSADGRSIALARASAIVLIGVPLVLIAYWWLAREAGRPTAITGGALLALSPNIVAHASLATTDACFLLCALMALAALTSYVQMRSRRTLVALATSLGLALSAKYSAVGLFAVVAITLLVMDDRADIDSPRPIRSRVLEVSAITVALVATALLMAWALHGFALVPTGLGPLGRPRLPAPVGGLLRQFREERIGHPAFLLGMRSRAGWWYYMPVALLLKSTPAEWLLEVMGLYAVFGRWRECSASVRVWRIAFLVYGSMALVNRVDIGVRYFLLLIPLGMFLAIERMSRIFAGRPNRLVGASVALVLLQASSAILIAPHYLSYVNGFVGGPAEGYRYLADSNLDWGQDLPALKEAFARVGARRPLLSYFGSARPEAYGVFATNWPGTQQDRDSADWIAISATNLDGVPFTGDPFAPFRAVSPSERAAYSIFLYATNRPEVQQAMAIALTETLKERTGPARRRS